MKPLLQTCLAISCSFLSPSLYAQLHSAGFDASLRPQTHIERAETEGWNELVNERSEYSSSYEQNGLKTIFQSKEPVNYKAANGQLIPIDIRFKETNKGWGSHERPDALDVDRQGNATIAHAGETVIGFGTGKINGSSTFTWPARVQTQNRSTLRFQDILPGISKEFHFKQRGIKFNYVIANPQNIAGSFFVITETFELPQGYVIRESEEEGEKSNSGWKGRLVIENKEGKICGKIHSLLCYDANNQTIEGAYRISKNGNGKYMVEMLVPKTWMNDASRAYPVVIDPLVTGPSTTYAPLTMPSCLMPAYYADSINITVPAGITVTKLSVTCSFYADPFAPIYTTMAAGSMYFSTSCNQTGTYEVTGPAAASAGTAYLDTADLRSPLMCCFPQQCGSYNFWLRYHLGRTINGVGCNTSYIRYDFFSTSWPFSAYIQGRTGETYGVSEMLLVPANICANTCTVEAKIYARYGVPPYTFTHPWSADTVVAGTPTGCGTGSQVKSLFLDIPGCPDYCNPATSKDVPPPVVTDACGVIVSNFNASYPLGIKPTPIVSFSTDTIQVCDGQNISATLNSCLPGSTITWNGNGLSGTTALADTMHNGGTSMQTTTYIAGVTLGTCTGLGDTLVVQTWPHAISNFDFPQDNLLPGDLIEFTNQSQLNGNQLASYVWMFEDSTLQLTTNATQTYSDTGTHQVCLYVLTTLGCNDTLCKTYVVLDTELELPNIITPNGDGINDVLYIKGLEYYPENTLKVFNRWGNQVFEKQNYTNDWKASGITDGTYYYVLTVPYKEDMTSVLQVLSK